MPPSEFGVHAQTFQCCHLVDCRAVPGRRRPRPVAAAGRNHFQQRLRPVCRRRREHSFAALPPAHGRQHTAFVRLEPALLAVSAERVKQAVWRQLGIDASAPWRGRILLALHPAATPDENVTIVFSRLVGVWNYRVELPDILSRARLTRALTGAVLLELANRDNPNARSAEIPAWLTEGLSQLLLAPGVADVILSPPDQAVNGLLQNRIVAVRHGVDPLAPARSVLNDHRALTFDELSWPDDAQLNGDDDGVYRASAHCS